MVVIASAAKRGWLFRMINKKLGGPNGPPNFVFGIPLFLERDFVIRFPPLPRRGGQGERLLNHVEVLCKVAIGCGNLH